MRMAKAGRLVSSRRCGLPDTFSDQLGGVSDPEFSCVSQSGGN
jgi:hypothetical protein